MGYTGKKPATSAQIDSSADIVDGVIQSQDIQTLDAAKLTGTVIDARISALTASKLTGTIDNARISLDAAEIPSLDAAKIATGTIADARISASSVTQHVAATLLDSPVITGTLSVADSGTVTHTIANWSEELSYTITPTNCTAGSVNASGQYVITHTSGNPSYTIKATTDSLGLADSALVTKNITMTLSAPTLSSPANVGTSVNVTYTITSTTGDDDKLILNIGSSNFTYQSVSVGTASKVGNTVECVGFTTNNPAVVIQYTAEATYSVTATSVKIDGSFGTSAASSADSITISNITYTVATGGNSITNDGDYKVHTFTASGSFVVTAIGTETTFSLMLVASGGGGGGGYSSGTTEGGGGGAGGLKYYTGRTIAIGTHAIVIGAGGTGGGSAYQGSQGATTTFTAAGISALTTTGGGGGGSRQTSVQPGTAGGSGGGGGQRDNSTANYGSGTTNEGHNGGSGYEGASMQGGGGGGAIAVGQNASNAVGGNGGNGVTEGSSSVYNWTTGSSTTLIISGTGNSYAGGGGGSGPTAGSGGTGGGGTGKVSAGLVNTGGGGGGNTGTTSYTGGSGIFIIRYKYQN